MSSFQIRIIEFIIGNNDTDLYAILKSMVSCRTSWQYVDSLERMRRIYSHILWILLIFMVIVLVVVMQIFEKVKEQLLKWTID